jgi:hypothetical protein
MAMAIPLPFKKSLSEDPKLGWLMYIFLLCIQIIFNPIGS